MYICVTPAIKRVFGYGGNDGRFVTCRRMESFTPKRNIIIVSPDSPKAKSDFLAVKEADSQGYSCYSPMDKQDRSEGFVGFLSITEEICTSNPESRGVWKLQISISFNTEPRWEKSNTF